MPVTRRNRPIDIDNYRSPKPNYFTRRSWVHRRDDFRFFAFTTEDRVALECVAACFGKEAEVLPQSKKRYLLAIPNYWAFYDEELANLIERFQLVEALSPVRGRWRRDGPH